MKLLRYTVLLVISLLAFGSCAEIQEPDYRETEYGHVQFKLYKAASYGQTKAVVSKLDYLNDAAKIKVTLKYEENLISQTLVMNSSDPESAEFGLRSDKLKLLSGTYQILTYSLFDKMDELLYEATPSAEHASFEVVPGGLSVHDLLADVVERGKVKFSLVKDMSGFTKEAGNEYTFDEIRTVTLSVRSSSDVLTVFEHLPAKFSIHFDDEKHTDADGNEIARIEGTITHKGTTTNKTADFTSEVKFTRTTPGEAVAVPAKSKLVTFAAKNLRNPDLTIIYMGQNGGYKSLDILYQQYRAMIDYAFPEGPENYIVLGFHNHTKLATDNVDNAYWNFFEGPEGFGVNESAGRPVSRFVNLYKELTGDNYADYLTLSGAAASPLDIAASDKAFVEDGMLPRSYWFDPEAGDIHPNEFGAKAFANAVYKKIVELGYLD